MNDNRPIGIFDSGVGGLTVTKEIKRLLPNENIIYYGDTKHLPYGDKSKETIVKYTTKITKFLLKRNCKLIVVACNTATANAIDEIRETAGNVPVIDVISPVAKKVAYDFNQKIGVIATKSTIHSHAYRKNIRKLNKHIQVIELATPLLVPIIEEGFRNTPISKAAIEAYLSHKKLENIDSLILGCTHYPLLQKEIENLFQGRVKVINSPLIVVNELILKLENLHLKGNTENPDFQFYLSDYTENFVRLSKSFFGKSITITRKLL
ncbi:MAG: glutamate racemase [Weeksellaceae bacterium]|jgi:glutamate racemase|nr:glutamate racemase [Weeksellaceae bacterium]MDX9705094.1 glutamate racemase [Weeksellaceae bacterium]